MKGKIIFRAKCPHCGCELKYNGYHLCGSGWAIDFEKCSNENCHINNIDLEYGGFCFETSIDPLQRRLEFCAENSIL